MYFDSILDLGDTLCAIGVKESAAANEAFTKFGEYHRQMEKVGISMLKKTKRVSISILYFRKVSYVISNTFWEHALNIYFYIPFECYQLLAMLWLDIYLVDR